MQLAFRIMGRKSESVTTSVARRENTTVLVFIVQRLMNIANIMDQKSQSI